MLASLIVALLRRSWVHSLCSNDDCVPSMQITVPGAVMVHNDFQLGWPKIDLVWDFRSIRLDIALSGLASSFTHRQEQGA